MPKRKRLHKVWTANFAKRTAAKRKHNDGNNNSDVDVIENKPMPSTSANWQLSPPLPSSPTPAHTSPPPPKESSTDHAPLPSTSFDSSSADSQATLPTLTTPPQLRNELMKTTEKEEKKVYDDKFLISRSQLEEMSLYTRCVKGNCRGKIQVIPNASRWDTDFEVFCEKCKEKKHILSKKVKDKKRHLDKQFSEVNIEEVYHSLMSGIGQAGLRRQSGFVGREAITSGSYARHCNFLYDKMESHYENIEIKLTK